ncbi:MAG: phosphatidylglycerophosphatase A [Phycisphaeraceae bacterium]|nr:MAG: phosphatidylglycerophosphatase A [Phycisphaeraceae bacterium]
MIPRRSDPRWLAVTVFGLGHLRPAPGTWGSLPPVVIAGVLVLAGLGPAEHPVFYHTVLAVILLVSSAACVAFGEWAEAWYGKKDPGWVVADETAGQCVALVALPVAAPALTIAGLWPLCVALAVSFLAFRAFDIIKPPPAYALQKLPGGWGVLVDDLFAGVYALIATQAVCWVLL